MVIDSYFFMRPCWQSCIVVQYYGGDASAIDWVSVISTTLMLFLDFSPPVSSSQIVLSIIIAAAGCTVVIIIIVLKNSLLI